MKGLEPSRLAALVPKTSVSTNSTTSANELLRKYSALYLLNKDKKHVVCMLMLAADHPLLDNNFMSDQYINKISMLRLHQEMKPVELEVNRDGASVFFWDVGLGSPTGNIGRVGAGVAARSEDQTTIVELSYVGTQDKMLEYVDEPFVQQPFHDKTGCKFTRVHDGRIVRVLSMPSLLEFTIPTIYVVGEPRQMQGFINKYLTASGIFSEEAVRADTDPGVQTHLEFYLSLTERLLQIGGVLELMSKEARH